MTKLNFPGVGKPSRGFISEMRTWFQIIASFAAKSPGSVPDINSQLAVLAAATGFETEPEPLPGNQAVVTNGDDYTDGDYGVVINVVAGVISVSVTDNS